MELRKARSHGFYGRIGKYLLILVSMIGICLVAITVTRPYGLTAWHVLSFNPPRRDPIDRKIEQVPDTFFIDHTSFHDIPVQGYSQCSAYSISYRLAQEGVPISADELYAAYPHKLHGGNVVPASIKDALQKHGFDLHFYRGTQEQLKKRLVYENKAIPVIVGDFRTYLHYMDVVGFDAHGLYFYDSLNYQGAGSLYNRYETNESFRELWDLGLPFMKGFYLTLERSE